MGGGSDRSGSERSEERSYALGLARGFGAAFIFSTPMLLTMEFWWLGFYADRLRLALFLLIMVPVLVALGFFVGLRPTSSWTAEALDAASAYGIGLSAAAAALFLLGIVTLGMPPREIIGKIALLGAVASFGAMLGRGQLGSQGGKQEEEKEKKKSGYAGQLVLELAGALYLSLTVAATVEMIKIPFKMTEWHGIAVMIVSVALFHAFVFALEFKGSVPARGEPWWRLLVRYTLPGYTLALAVSAYLLWTFGRFEGLDPRWIVLYTVTLGLPATIGAAAGRLLL